MLQTFPPVLMWISLSFSQLRLLNYFSISRLNIIGLLESIKFVMFLPVTQFTESLYARFSSSAVLTLWGFMRNSMADSGFTSTLLYFHLVFIR